MNNDLNHGTSRKEKKMNAITKATLVAVLVSLDLALAVRAAEPPKSEPQKGNDAPGAAHTRWPAPVPGFVPVQFDGRYVEETDANPAGNYIVFRGLTGPKQTLTLASVKGAKRPAISAIQIIRAR